MAVYAFAWKTIIFSRAFLLFSFFFFERRSSRLLNGTQLNFAVCSDASHINIWLESEHSAAQL